MFNLLKRILLSIALIQNTAVLATPVTQTGLFGFHEYEKKNLSLFPQWLSVVERHVKDVSKAKSCNSPQLNQCTLKEWLAFLGSIASLPVSEQIRQVNLFANEKAYVLDRENYGVADYWATPKEFLRNNGDCEDFAIIKMLSLKWLGYDVNRMRVVVVQDTNLSTAHAVMSIEYQGDVYILDNQIPEVLSHNAIFHYVPVYSINEKHWWMHVPD